MLNFILDLIFFWSEVPKKNVCIFILVDFIYTTHKENITFTKSNYWNFYKNASLDSIMVILLHMRPESIPFIRLFTKKKKDFKKNLKHWWFQKWHLLKERANYTKRSHLISFISAQCWRGKKSRKILKSV